MLMLSSIALLISFAYRLICTMLTVLVFFFFQAEDGIRDIGVTGVQTCALPICGSAFSMMRSMRASAKYIFYVLAVAFIVWLVVGQVTEILGGARDVVLKVDGQDVRLQQFQAVFQSALEEQRRQGAGRLSREEEQRIQNQVADQLIQAILLQREYRRLGIRVSDDELRQAARSSPPPQILRQVAEDAT